MYEGSEIRGLRQRLLHGDDRPDELATTTEASAEENETEVLTTTTDESIESRRYNASE